MLVVYLLLFSLLHLSSSACSAADVEATARWNRRLLVLLPADVPSSSSPAAAAALRHEHHDHHAAMHAASTSSREHVRAASAKSTTRRLKGWPSPAPDVELRDVVEGGNGMPRARAMMMSPSPRGDDGGYKEAAGGEAGGQSSSELIITGDGPERNEDIGIDYAAPKTHPPSHN